MVYVTYSLVGMARYVDVNLLTDSGLNPKYFLRRIPYLWQNGFYVEVIELFCLQGDLGSVAGVGWWYQEVGLHVGVVIQSRAPGPFMQGKSWGLGFSDLA